MKYYLTILAIFIISLDAKSQENEFIKTWKDSIFKHSEFKEINIIKFSCMDLSEIISNQTGPKDDPWSTYIGVFGVNYQRIDFHIEAKKDTSNSYIITGKSKLYEKIRNISGNLNLTNTLFVKDFLGIDTLYLCVFNYQFLEFDNNNEVGIYKGIFTAMFSFDKGQLALFWSESGDYSEYNHMFVGKWESTDSKIGTKCIFSFYPAGLYNNLPFCNEFYIKDDLSDFYKINDKYKNYGWNDFDPNNVYKTNWWEN